MLDFSQLLPQIAVFTGERVNTLQQYQEALEEAGRRLRDSEALWETTQARIVESRTSWLLAGWREPPDARYTAPPRPLPHVVLAADGSQIVAERHDIAPCYVLNVGLIVLRYGTGERATLTSRPTLANPDEDLYEAQQEGEQSVIAPRRLGIRRLQAELAGLAELIETLPHDMPALALFDGSLILWTLEGETEDFRQEALQAFETGMETAKQRRVPIVGYISQPQSRDVINSLRVHVCPKPKAQCDSHCPSRSKTGPEFRKPECAGTERITDALLFSQRLAPGERSAVFSTEPKGSKIMRHYSDAHKICFFYLHVGAEIARIEIPLWVAIDPELLAQTHALCYDQTQKGDGYPVALAEAHEQAVVRGAERDTFWHFMEKSTVQHHLPVNGTRKALSKRTRRV